MIRQFNIRARTGERDGIALVTALGLLLIFMMLGTAYVRYMSIELAGARYEMNDSRSENLSTAGIQAAMGEIQYALENGDTPSASYEFDLSVYRTEGGERVSYPQKVTVTVTDADPFATTDEVLTATVDVPTSTRPGTDVTA